MKGFTVVGRTTQFSTVKQATKAETPCEFTVVGRASRFLTVKQVAKAGISWTNGQDHVRLSVE